MVMGLLAGLAMVCSPAHADTITHNISSRGLTISSSSTDDYVVYGTTTTNRLVVQSGYRGTITLRNCKFDISSGDSYSAITLCSSVADNLHPNTVVDLVLEGNNYVFNSGGNRACIEVRQGAQLNIRAVDPNNNLSGTLCALQSNISGGAAIGARIEASEGTINGKVTAGGNITISSGIVTAKGGHGAGIGGGYLNFYDGIIFIYGGIVNSSATFDAAGIGSGCPRGSGIINEYTPHSSIIVLPPAVITAYGAGYTASGGVGYSLFATLGLAGTKTIVYIGDVNKPAISVRTSDLKPDADVYVDLSQNADVMTAYNAVIDPSELDINRIHFGRTGADGIYTFHGVLQNPTTFYTDATSSGAATEGRPYLATTVASMTTGGTVVLNPLAADIRVQSVPSVPLPVGYSYQEAESQSQKLLISYNSTTPLTGVQFSLANGNTIFPAIKCFGADGTTSRALPTTLQNGDSYVLRLPIGVGRGPSIYNDVLRIAASYNGQPIGYIRKVVSQGVVSTSERVVYDSSAITLFGRTISETGYYYDTISISGNESTMSYTSCVGVTYSSQVTTARRDSVVGVHVVFRLPVYDTLMPLSACDSYTWATATFICH